MMDPNLVLDGVEAVTQARSIQLFQHLNNLFALLPHRGTANSMGFLLVRSQSSFKFE